MGVNQKLFLEVHTIHVLHITLFSGTYYNIYIYKYKNNCLMKSEVGMAVLKSKQTRVVGVISTYV